MGVMAGNKSSSTEHSMLKFIECQPPDVEILNRTVLYLDTFKMLVERR